MDGNRIRTTRSGRCGPEPAREDTDGGHSCSTGGQRAQGVEVEALKRLLVAEVGAAHAQVEKKYGAARLEAACSRAYHDGTPGFKVVKSILEKGLDLQALLAGRGTVADE